MYLTRTADVLSELKHSYNRKSWDPSRPKSYGIIQVLLTFFSLVKRLKVSPKKALIWLRSKIVFAEGPATNALFNNLDEEATPAFPY